MVETTTESFDIRFGYVTAQQEHFAETLQALSDQVSVIHACIKTFEKDLQKNHDQYRRERTENTILRDAIRQVIDFLRLHASSLKNAAKEDEAMSFMAVVLTLELMLSSPQRETGDGA